MYSDTYLPLQYHTGQFHCAQNPLHSACSSLPLLPWNLWPPPIFILQCKAQSLSHIQLCDPMDYTCQAPQSMGFSRQENWAGLPFPSPVDLPDPGIEPTSPVSPALTGGFFTTEPYYLNTETTTSWYVIHSFSYVLSINVFSVNLTKFLSHCVYCFALPRWQL